MSQHYDRINWFVVFSSLCVYYLSCFDSLFHPVYASVRVSVSVLTLISIVEHYFQF